MAEIKVVDGKYLEYKGKPLVREDNIICYGDMSEKCMLILEILSYKKEGGKDVPDNVFIQVVNPKDMSNVLREGCEKGLFEALEIGLRWYDHEMKK